MKNANRKRAIRALMVENGTNYTTAMRLLDSKIAARAFEEETRANDNSLAPASPLIWDTAQPEGPTKVLLSHKATKSE